MKKILTLLSSLFFTVFIFSNANSAGDEEAIKKLSSFKKTGIDVVAEVIEQDTKFRRNIEKNILPRNLRLPIFKRQCNRRSNASTMPMNRL